ncbi:MAG: hypothetical protein VYD64_08985 [Pseudomonadota bacterium]|nr:hypothetical protein [Pseudomonadota bacterium]
MKRVPDGKHFNLGLLALAAMAALAGCNGSALELRGVGTPTRQTVATMPQEPQVVTSGFEDVAATAPDQTGIAQPQALAAVPPQAGQPPTGQSPTTQSPTALSPTAQSPTAQSPAAQPPAAPPPATAARVAAPPPAGPEPVTAQPVVARPEMGKSREVAVREMREKAAAATKAPPNVFDMPESRATPLTEEEREALLRRLEATADQNAANISEEEAARRQEATKALLRKAGSHYNDALSSIEN